LGHDYPEIIKVIIDHVMYLDDLFSSVVSPSAISLRERLCATIPSGFDMAFFRVTGGEDNNETAKMAKTFARKFEIEGLDASRHSMMAQAIGSQYHGPLMAGMYILPVSNCYRSVFRNVDGSYD